MTIGTRSFVALAVLASTAGCSAQAHSRAAARAETICGARHAPGGDVRRLSTEMTLGEIIAVLGEPEADVGSGLHVFEWSCSDGRRIHVSVASDDKSTKPIAVNGPQ